MRHRSAPYRLALAAATFVAAAVASYAQTALPVLTRELFLQSNSVGNPLIQISAPSALGPAYSLILPPGPGNVGDVLTWSASTGALVWEAPSTGSWALLGNSINTAGTGAGEVFLGTRNDQPLILATTNTVTPQPMRFLTGNTERMRILAGGNVGIGTATPTTLLDVAGTFRATGTSTIGGTLTLSSVAQGVAGDSVLLINASNEVTRTSRSSLIASMGWALAGNAGTTALQYIGTSDAQPLSIRTDGLERLRILSTGQIGIGVATPTSTLEVGGTLRVNTGGGATSALTVFQANPAHTNPYIRAEMNDGTAMFTIGSDGSLFARGSLTIDALGGTATSPTPAGYNRILIANASGQVEEASINAVVAEGIQANAWALRGNSAALDAGAFVGQEPVPTGNYLGTTGTTGLSFVTDSVIRVQISSLGDMTVQFDMRVNGLTLGKGGGGQLTNTALGRDALRDNTTGERNTAMGNQSLMASRFGSSNTSVGFSSQTANFSGSNNTSFGSEALYSIIATDNNVAVGAQALYSLEGNGNTAVGFNALRNITSGNGNVALGTLAGTQTSSNTELLSATNSIFIGNDARASASAQSNQIVIGHGAVGIGTNSVVIGNNTTESTRLRGRLGVGVNPAGGVGDAQVQIRTATAASMGLIVRGILDQTGNLLELQDSLGVANLTVTPNGSTTIAGTLTLNSVASGLSSDSVLLINASNQVTRTSRAALFAGSGWALTGNANTSALNYLGTSDLQPLSIRTNATERIRIATDGKTGIGVSTPLTRLHVSNGALLMDDAYEDYDSNAVLIVHKTPTAEATLNDPLPLLYLAREGTLDEAFAAGVEMSLSRYEDVAENSRTRFDIALANDNFLASKNTVMTMRSAGFVGINNTAPTVALDITGGLRATGTVTLTNVAQGVAADSVLLINASNQVTKTTRASLFAGSGWALVGNATSDAWNGTAGVRLGTTSAQPMVIATTNATAQDIQFFTGTNGANERMRIAGASGAVTMQNTLTVSGLITGNAGAALSGATVAINENSNNTTNINTGTSTGAVNIGTGTASGTVSIGRTGGTITTIGALGHTGAITSSGLITGNGGATISGATGITGATTINTTGNANTTIGSATTTGTTTIATNGTSGRLLVTGLPVVDNTNTDNVMLVDPATGNVSRTTRADLFAGSGWSLVGNFTSNAWNGTTGTRLGTTSAQPMVIATTNATAQDIQFFTGANGANERMRIAGTTGLVTMQNALTVSGLITGSAGATISGATVAINENSNNTTNINTGTSTGAVNIGTGAASGTVSIGRTGGTITTIGALGHTGTITSSGLITTTAGINLSGAASPLQANGSDGTSGQVLVSAGAGATPTWANAQAAAGIKSKGRSAVLTAQSTFVITGLTNVDVNDGVSIVLESDNDDMDIPPYFIKRVASPTAGSITVRFSAPFAGYVTWVVVD